MSRFLTPLTLIVALIGCQPGTVPVEGSDEQADDTAAPADDTAEPSTDDTGTEAAVDADLDGYSTVLDCDDSDASVNPDATESCDNVDNDCDGEIDEGLPTVDLYPDVDSDGYGDAWSDPVESCEPIVGYVTDNTDCNDADSATYPGATDETGDGIDQNCDDGADNGETGSTDTDGDGSLDSEDCDPTDATVYPGATESENGIDDDCDGSVDEGFEAPEPDADGDGNPDSEDCNDSDATIYPGATEVFDDGIDSDCDGSENSGWEAYVLATYPVSDSFTLNTALYSSGSAPNARSWSDESVSVTDNEAEVEYLTSEYGDVSGFCGLIINGDGYGFDDLCWGGSRDTTVAFDIYFDGTWYDESDLDVWIADATDGECALILQVSSSSSCTPVDDE